MALSKETIEEFRIAIKEEHGDDLSFEQASKILHQLVDYFKLLTKLSYKNNASEQCKCDQCTMHDKL